MQLKDNWKAVAVHAWSMRFMAASFIFSGLEVTVQVMIAFSVTPPFIHPGVFAIAAGVITVFAMGARLIVQQGV